MEVDERSRGETPHKRFRRRARKLYRIIIVVCVLVLIFAIIVAYIKGGI